MVVRLRQRNRFHRGGTEDHPEPDRGRSHDAVATGEAPRVALRRPRSLERQRAGARPVIWLAALLAAVLTAILLLR